MTFFDWFRKRSNNSSSTTRNSASTPSAQQNPPAQQIPSYVLATSSALIPPYIEGFDQALRFTKSLGYNTTSLSLSNTGIDLLDAQGSFVDPAFQAAGIVDRTQAAAQCLKFCRFLQPHFQQHLGKRVMLTTGQLWKGETCMFGPTFDDVRRWNANGLQEEDFEVGGGFKLHAWLTVESGEIIEPTLLSSLALVGHESFKKYAGATVHGRDPNVLNHHRYVPITVGNDIIDHIAKKSFVPILATKISELKPAHAILIR